MKRFEYTHKAKFQGIPCFFNVETDALTGRNWFYSLLIDAVILIRRYLPVKGQGYDIELLDDLDESNLVH